MTFSFKRLDHKHMHESADTVKESDGQIAAGFTQILERSW